MIGTALALLVAFFVAGRDALSKIVLKETDEYMVCWATALFSFLFMLPTLFFIPIPFLRDGFLLALFFGAVLNFLARLIFLKAVKIADLSLVAPLLSFSPVFLVLASPLATARLPGIPVVAGVGLLLAGSCLLVLRGGGLERHAPLRKLLMERWARMGLIVAFIWSLAGIVDGVGIYDSAPLFWGVSIQGFMVLLGLPFVIRRTWARGGRISPRIKSVAPIGLYNAVVIGLYMLALNFASVSFVFSFYQASIIFSIFLGWLLFKERNVLERLQGGSVMLAGMVVMSVF
ncbi:MAG: DMT family transporter [Actinomycetota bacterium]|nr:DMT family transporter [Actinomycetota bacterium]